MPRKKGMTIEGFLEKHCEEIAPTDFYRMIFPDGELERRGEYEQGKYTAIAVSIGNKDKRVKRYSVTDELATVDELAKTDDFCILAPISYAGKSRASTNARYLYALAVDVDGVYERKYKGEPMGMWTLFYQFDGHGPSNYLPKPTAIVMSGSGIHVYYVFEKPIPLFKNVVEQLQQFKRQLTWMLWTQGVSMLSDHVQYESLFQGFRMPGTITKSGGRARAFLVDRGDKVTMEYMNGFVPPEYRAEEIVYKSSLTRAEAKKKYPKWYKERVEQGRPKNTWVCNRALYDWWKQRIIAKAVDGHRYWCLMTLATYAKKCGISFEELKDDAYELRPLLDARGERPDNPFTSEDVRAALKAYDDKYITYPIDTISVRTGIQIEKNKRNGRKQAAHLARARAVQDVDYPDGSWRNKDGRPSKENIVKEWRNEHRGGTKAECIRETGLSKHTVYKWWWKI